jgi:hypothetical protein
MIEIYIFFKFKYFKTFRIFIYEEYYHYFSSQMQISINKRIYIDIKFNSKGYKV